MESPLLLMRRPLPAGGRVLLRALLDSAAVLAVVFAPLTVPAAEETSRPAERASAIISRIRHQPVDSRALASVGYSKRLRALEIAFRRGGTYRYLEVPPTLFHDLLAAESKARFYNHQVRGKYRSVRVRRNNQ
jgi:hypothetical protein